MTHNKNDDQKYNGWTNRDTWAAHLWLSNDHSTYRLCREVSNNPTLLFTQIAIGIIEGMGNPDDIQFSRVNWEEVRSVFIDETKC